MVASVDKPVALRRLTTISGRPFIAVLRKNRLIGQIYQQENKRWYVVVCLHLAWPSEHVDEHAIRRATYTRFTTALRKLLKAARKHEARTQQKEEE